MTTSLSDVTGAILAGGMGTRLRSVVADRPKVLAPVLGRPYLAYLLDQLAEAGLRRVVLLTGYLSDQIEAAFGKSYGPIQLSYSVEQAPLGTAGAIRAALPLIPPSTVLLLNGDSYCHLDLIAFSQFHRHKAARCSMALAHVADTSRYGKVVSTAEDRVTRYLEKQAAGGEGWINAGFYLLDRALIAEIPSDRPVSIEREMFPAWAEQGICYGFRAAGAFIDIGTPQSYAEAAAFFAPRQAA